jgi:hypothetical protein
VISWMWLVNIDLLQQYWPVSQEHHRDGFVQMLGAERGVTSTEGSWMLHILKWIMYDPIYLDFEDKVFRPLKV